MDLQYHSSWHLVGFEVCKEEWVDVKFLFLAYYSASWIQWFQVKMSLMFSTKVHSQSRTSACHLRSYNSRSYACYLAKKSQKLKYIPLLAWVVRRWGVQSVALMTLIRQTWPRLVRPFLTFSAIYSYSEHFSDGVKAQSSSWIFPFFGRVFWIDGAKTASLRKT